MTSKKQFNITLNADLIEITKAMPDGLIVFHHPKIGGGIYRSGDMNRLIRFATHRMGVLSGEAEQQVYLMATQVLKVAEEKYKADIRIFLDIMKGQEPPHESPLKELPTFLLNNTVSDFSVLVICCNESNGFFSARGDMLGVGSILLSAIANGNIPIWDFLTRIKQEVQETRKGIN